MLRLPLVSLLTLDGLLRHRLRKPEPFLANVLGFLHRLVHIIKIVSPNEFVKGLEKDFP